MRQENGEICEQRSAVENLREWVYLYTDVQKKNYRFKLFEFAIFFYTNNVFETLHSRQIFFFAETYQSDTTDKWHVIRCMPSYLDYDGS